VETKFNRLFIDVDEAGASERKKETVARYTTSLRCPDCDGTRLADTSRTATVGGHTLPAVTALDDSA
jgi:excinuclease UvrABC ATPase subunit